MIINPSFWQSLQRMDSSEFLVNQVHNWVRFKDENFIISLGSSGFDHLQFNENADYRLVSIANKTRKWFSINQPRSYSRACKLFLYFPQKITNKIFFIRGWADRLSKLQGTELQRRSSKILEEGSTKRLLEVGNLYQSSTTLDLNSVLIGPSQNIWLYKTPAK